MPNVSKFPFFGFLRHGTSMGRIGRDHCPPGTWIVMPRFGPEPKFEPEPGRTEPRSGLKVQVSGRTGPMVRFGVQRMTVFCRTGLNPSEPELY
jgi:hypothetical protein